MTFFPPGNVWDVFWMGCLDKCWTGLADFLQCESNKLTNHFKGGFFNSNRKKETKTLSDCTQWAASDGEQSNKCTNTHTHNLCWYYRDMINGGVSPLLTKLFLTFITQDCSSSHQADLCHPFSDSSLSLSAELFSPITLCTAIKTLTGHCPVQTNTTAMHLHLYVGRGKEKKLLHAIDWER